MSQTKHIADAESNFWVLNVTPDFCQVGNSIIPFDICQKISNEKTKYSKTVFARDEKVLLVDSVIKGVKGNAGKGVISSVSGGGGDTVIMQGSSSVIVEGKSVARHDDLVAMNVKA
jgi:hypothetical protein